LAEAIGLEPDTIGRFERGLRLPSLASLARLAETLGVAVVDLLADDDSWARAAGSTAGHRQLVETALQVPEDRTEAAYLMVRGLLE